MSETTKLRRSERLYRWKDGDTWRSGWVLICGGFSQDEWLNGQTRRGNNVLVHCSLLQDIYEVPAQDLKLVPRREEYE